MVHMILHNTIILVLLSGTWCHDLLFFDEFQFSFDLTNANDWEHYFINTNLKPSSKENNYINKLYQNEQIINNDKNLFSKLNYAKTCTHTIPLLLKQLCVHWKHDQGFKYNYRTPTYSSQIDDTNWYYNNDNNNRVSDAQTSDKYYSLLDNNMRYIGDDSNWNEINYANSLSSFTMDNDDYNNNYFTNFAKGSFKQCRHSIRMRECVQFHLPSKKLTVNVKVARARKHNSYRRRLYSDSDSEEYDDYSDSEYEGIYDENYMDEYGGYYGGNMEDIYDENSGQYDEDYTDEYGGDVEDIYDENSGQYDEDYTDEYGGDVDDIYEGFYDGYNDYDGYAQGYYDDENSEDDSAYDSHGEFEYGDSMGYDNWSAEIMKWKSFKCLDCLNGRRLYEYYDDMDSYDEYGDYTYLFNEYGLDFDDDDDWYDISKDGKMKCSIAIPGFEHKLCVDVRHDENGNNGAKISFAVAQDEDIDYGYYDVYGYDQYYYNIDHLYTHKRRMVEDSDEYDENYEGYDYLFGDDMYDDDYDYMEQYYDAIDQEYITNLRNELSDISLNFLDDDIWNDITTIYDESNDKYLRKCKSFEVAKLCAIHSLSDPSKSIQLKLKIGKYKFHRSNNQKYRELSTYSSNINYMNIYNDNVDENENENEQEHWIISDEILDLDDDEWDDNSLWNPAQDQILTNILEKVVQLRCRSHTYCLCQYVDKSFDGGKKHPCAKGKINEPQKVVHVMDDFVKTPKPEFIPLHDYHKSPLRIEFHYKPHIEHLHVVGGLPFFHRRNHRKRHMIPWYKYSRYESLRPKDRPKWLPHWMWREIGAHIHHDPRQVERIMNSLRHKGLLVPNGLVGLRGNMKGKNVKQGGLLAQLKKSGNKVGNWFKKTGNKMGNWFKDKFSANEMDGEYYDNGYSEDLYYYDYDEDLADKLDGMRDNSDTGDMLQYVFPIFEEDAESVQPVLESMNDMVGNTAMNKFAQNVGIRRRMEDNTNEYMQNANEDIDDLYDYYDSEDEYEDEYNDEMYDNYDEYMQNSYTNDDMYDYYNDYEYDSEDEYNDMYDDNDYYSEDEYDNEYAMNDIIIDNWYDRDDGLNWIMLSNELSYDTLYEFENNENDKIIKNIITSSGKKVKRRCMRIFGRQLCICQFLKYIGAQRADHLCFPKQTLKKYITPKVIKKKLKLKPKKYKKPLKLKPNIGKYKVKKKPLKLKPKRKKKSKTKPIVHKLKLKLKKPKKLKPKPIKLKRKKPKKLKLKPHIKKKLAPKLKLKPKKSKHKKLKNAIGLRDILRKHGLIRSKNTYKPLIKRKISKPKALIKKNKFIKQKLTKRKGPKRYKLWKKKNKKRVNIPNDYHAQQKWIMEESNKIRKIVKSGLPKVRPLWFPHYFWHWLHSAPHFHVLRHKRRVPWTASSANVNERDMDVNSAAKSLDYNMYQYGVDSDVDYNGLVDGVYMENMNDAYDEGYNAMEEYGDVMEDYEGVYDENMEDIYSENEMEFDGDYYEDYNDENEEGYDGIYEEYVEDINDENEGEYDGLDLGYYENENENDNGFNDEYDGIDVGYYENENDNGFNVYEEDNNENELVSNALENGNDFIGVEDDINTEMWQFETMFLFMVISIIFCILTFCFVWKSKWGALIRKLNEQRINKNKMIFEARKRMEILNDIDSSDDNNDSSSLNISDVAPLNNNNYNNDV